MAPELLPEIYLHSAQFISSPSTIANCCLVSKEFYRIFTPYLYKHLNLRTGPPNPDEKSEHDPTRALRRLRIAYLNDRFLFTKHFEISVHTGNDIIMSRYLSSMSNIVSFSAENKMSQHWKDIVFRGQNPYVGLAESTIMNYSLLISREISFLVSCRLAMWR
ncbi:uncharacterized protein LY89DRAFT_248086 [Mollisia scopiformis]|uniref:Uncharacterized protein n=1 Tax=Mollisia scopiformis TaxID=149040 RepID=A0A194WSJ0_MOLSC|nr:uncharacterized protein LY89DRAFT_248086 [Mollisia scopiformis]KUJ10654.1 hypothetical protein LY89DRAFT_248086 [Mollisia scopiformis]